MREMPILHISSAKSVARDIQSDCGYIIISSETKYDYLARCSNVLILHFADTEDNSRFDAITSYDAKKIRKFINACIFKDCFVSCDAGESRSPAVVAALIRLRGEDDSYIWKTNDYRPNVLVYKTVLNTSAHLFSNPEARFKMLDYMSPEEYRQHRRKNAKADSNRKIN